MGVVFCRLSWCVLQGVVGGVGEGRVGVGRGCGWIQWPEFLVVAFLGLFFEVGSCLAGSADESGVLVVDSGSNLNITTLLLVSISLNPLIF